MKSKSSSAAAVDEYIAQYPPDVRKILTRMRSVIKKAAPGAEEKISYKMPGYFLNGQLVWFGAHSTHIGLYPTAEGMEAFKKELVGYKQSKGAVQFPLDQPIPYDLVTKIVKHRVAHNLKK